MTALEPASTGRLTSRPRPGAGGGAAGTYVLDEVGLPETLLHVPSAAGPAPLLVFFHGAGGTAAGTLPLVRAAADAAGALVLVPTSAGSTWDLLTGGLGRDVATLDTALEHVLSRHDVARVAFGGFSDGGSYALSLGLANGDLAEAVLAFSPGFAGPPVLVGAPRVWVSHGTRDAVLPVDRCGRRVAQRLAVQGLEVRYEEFDGGHVVRPQDVQAAFAWWLG